LRKPEKSATSKNVLSIAIKLSVKQAKVFPNIMNCKTGAYGANVSVYEYCGGHLGKPQLQIPQRC
jgi:hypothetical protein